MSSVQNVSFWIGLCKCCGRQTLTSVMIMVHKANLCVDHELSLFLFQWLSFILMRCSLQMLWPAIFCLRLVKPLFNFIYPYLFFLNLKSEVFHLWSSGLLHIINYCDLPQLLKWWLASYLLSFLRANDTFSSHKWGVRMCRSLCVQKWNYENLFLVGVNLQLTFWFIQYYECPTKPTVKH